jgi:hypothetical protein
MRAATIVRAAPDAMSPERHATGLGQDLADLAKFDRGTRVALSHAGAVSQPRRGPRRTIDRADASDVRRTRELGEDTFLTVHLPPHRHQVVGQRTVGERRRIEHRDQIDTRTDQLDPVLPDVGLLGVGRIDVIRIDFALHADRHVFLPSGRIESGQKNRPRDSRPIDGGSIGKYPNTTRTYVRVSSPQADRGSRRTTGISRSVFVW